MSDDETTRLLRAALDAAISYIFALEGQKEEVVVRARRSYEAALAALNEAEPLDISPNIGPSAKDGSNDPQCYDDLSGEPSPNIGGEPRVHVSDEVYVHAEEELRGGLGAVRTASAFSHTYRGHYLSTYCLHDEHESCRLTCKICEAPCRCACHATEVS